MNEPWPEQLDTAYRDQSASGSLNARWREFKQNIRRKIDMLFVSDTAYLSGLYGSRFGRRPNLAAPEGFNEKVICKILNDRRPLLTLFSDKLRVRDYVRARAPTLQFPTLYWWSADPETMPFERLPSRFVLKANHGSGWNVIVADKGAITRKTAVRESKRWLASDFTIVGRERAYSPIRRAVYAEELLCDANGNYPPDDYKLFVFGGKVRIIQVDHSRFTDHTQALYDRDWRRIEGTVAANPGSTTPAPASLSRMIEVAEMLSFDVDFVRVDLYDIAGELYFGELTNSPNKGLCPFSPSSLDRLFGDCMTLDDYTVATTVNYVPDAFAEKGTLDA